MKTRRIEVECPLCFGKGSIFASLQVDDIHLCFAAYQLQKQGVSLREIGKMLKIGAYPQKVKYYIDKYVKYQKELTK